MAHVLVTGGAGFIGSLTVDRLLANGHRVRVLDSLRPPVHADHPDYLPMEDIEFLHCDVTDRTAWELALAGVDAVYHLAAYQDYLPDFSEFFRVNTVATALLYEVAVERRLELAKVIVASTQAVYGEGSYACPRCEQTGLRPAPRPEERLRLGRWEIPCQQCGDDLQPEPTAETAVTPHNSYALSKHSAEQLALALGKRYAIPTVALRYSITQGSRQSFRNAYSGVLRIFAQRLLHGLQPICFEDGQQLRDYISVHDVVDANLTVLTDPRANGRVFNVGGNHAITTLEYAERVAAVIGTDIEPEVPGLYRRGDTRHIVSDINALSQLGWRPTRTLTQTITEYLDWLSSQPKLVDYSAAATAEMRHKGALRQAMPAVSQTTFNSPPPG